MMKVAYVLQNVGGARLDRDVGDSVVVKQSIKGLRDRGHAVNCVKLEGQRVLRMPGRLDLEAAEPVTAGIADSKAFTLFERGVRRLQRELGLPYYALFDSHRFYQATRGLLPEFDLCHEYHGLFSVGAALACRELDIPYVVSLPADQILERQVKGTPLRGIRAWLAKTELSFTLDSADRVICVSTPAKKRLVSAWGIDEAKISVLPNGADVELFSAPRDRAEIRSRLQVDGAPVVMFAGGFQVWHGLDRLIAAFDRMKSSLPEARLILVGDGPARPAVEEDIRKAGLQRTVRITGFVPQEEVAEMLAAADVAVVPYPPLPAELWFSPLKLFEYMAAGKAIVATRAGQIQEVITDGVTGVLVEPGNVEALEHALVELLQDPERRAELGRAAQDQALRQHSWRGYTRRLEQVFEDVLENYSWWGASV